MYCIVNLGYTVLMRPNRSKQSDQIVHGFPNTKSSPLTTYKLKIHIHVLVTSILVESASRIIHYTFTI